MRYAKSRLIGKYVMAPYVEHGPNHVAIGLDVGEAREVMSHLGTFTVGCTCFFE
jgi:hypothetical protein